MYNVYYLKYVFDKKKFYITKVHQKDICSLSWNRIYYNIYVSIVDLYLL